MARPLHMTMDVARHLWRTHRALKSNRRTPVVLMLEPLEACNLRCAGCGRVREYEDQMHLRMDPDTAIAAARVSGAPIVSVSGGEPLLHEGLRPILHGLLEERRWVFLCTNGLLLEEKLDSLPRDKRLCLVVHLDGTEKVHDRVTDHPGAYRRALTAIREATKRGLRVCTNTTVFHGSDVEDVRALFQTLKELRVEGVMLSPGYAYASVEERELFLQREESVKVFRRLLAAGDGTPFYDNPLFLEFLQGMRNYDCSAWAVPTYTVAGWRLPCYLIADRHVEQLDEVLDPSVWATYGPGRDPRCTGCMVHAGFEAASALDAIAHPWRLLGVGRQRCW